MDFTARNRIFYAAEGFGLAYQNLDSEEWNLAALSSRLFFSYEEGAGIDDLAAEFDEKMLTALKETIEQELESKTVRWYMQQPSPFTFLGKLMTNSGDADELALSRFWRTEFYLFLVKARCLAWRATHRVEKLRIYPHLNKEEVECIKLVREA
ncbi:MAG: hypothetical protein J0665_12090 [Deltaproteobacteria bacterium]|nr:hypothetical protein [Deltaproteobacteria bacterium]